MCKAANIYIYIYAQILVTSLHRGLFPSLLDTQQLSIHLISQDTLVYAEKGTFITSSIRLSSKEFVFSKVL